MSSRYFSSYLIYLIPDTTSIVKATACRNVHLRCIVKGFNRVRVKYEREDISLKKAAIVACYRKLKVRSLKILHLLSII